MPVPKCLFQILPLGTPKPGRCKNLPALDLFPSSFSPALGHLWLVLKEHIKMMVCVSCLLGFPAPVHLENQVFFCAWHFVKFQETRLHSSCQMSYPYLSRSRTHAETRPVQSQGEPQHFERLESSNSAKIEFNPAQVEAASPSGNNHRQSWKVSLVSRAAAHLQAGPCGVLGGCCFLREEVSHIEWEDGQHISYGFSLSSS